MTADQSTPPRNSGGWTRIVLVPVGVVLMLIGASQVFAWTAYKVGALPMGLWQVLEHGGLNGVLAENVEASIGRGLAWTVGFVIVSVVILGIVRRRAAHRLPVGVVVLGAVLVTSWALPGSAGLTHAV